MNWMSVAFDSIILLCICGLVLGGYGLFVVFSILSEDKKINVARKHVRKKDK